MNHFGFIDYKKPQGNSSDMRTSSHRAHVYMTDTMNDCVMDPKFAETRSYEPDRQLNEGRISDYKGNFGWKFSDPLMVRNPTLNPNIQMLTTFEATRLRFLKRPLLPAKSTSHQDYVWHPDRQLNPPYPDALPAEVKATKIVIDRNKHGYSKYLDPSATTSRLTYVNHTPKEILASIAAHDNINFWNWYKNHPIPKRVFPERDVNMCNDAPATHCIKRRSEFPSLVKAVPHSGMTTEVRKNYVEPYKRAVDYHVNIYNDLVSLPAMPLNDNTDNKMYGSGECTQKYV